MGTTDDGDEREHPATKRSPPTNQRFYANLGGTDNELTAAESAMTTPLRRPQRGCSSIPGVTQRSNPGNMPHEQFTRHRYRATLREPRHLQFVCGICGTRYQTPRGQEYPFRDPLLLDGYTESYI